MPAQVLLQQPDELVVAAAALDRLGDRLADHVGDGAALGLGHELQLLGQLRVQPQDHVLGPLALLALWAFAHHSDITISLWPGAVSPGG